MNLDDLISKYIDGEITEEENLQLRSMTNSYESARTAYNAAIELHNEMHKDAESIVIPKKLYRNTEDILMMRFLNEDTVVARIVRKPNYMYRYLAAASIIFLFSILEIGDLKLGLPKQENGKKENISLNADNQRKHIEPVNKRKSVVEPIIQKYVASAPEIAMVKQSESVDIIPDHVPATSNLNNLKEEPVRNDLASQIPDNNDKNNNLKEEPIRNDLASQSPANNNNKDIAGVSKEKDNSDKQNNSKFDELEKSLPDKFLNSNETAANTEQKPNAGDLARMSMNNMHDQPNRNQLNENNRLLNDITNEFDAYQNEISLTSFFGTDIAQKTSSGTKQPSTLHFSQSIGYSFADKHKFGIEFGFSNYKYTNNQNSTSQSIVKKQPSDGTIETTKDEGNGVLFQTLPFDNNSNEKLYWAAAFYEYGLYQNEDLSIAARLGVGSSIDGPLGYTRLFAKYDVFSGFALTLGADGRVFSSYQYGPLGKEKILNGTISIIYGFQIKF